MFPYATDAYATFCFSDDKQNGLLSLGFRDKFAIDSHINVSPNQYHCCVVLNGTGTYRYKETEFYLKENSVYQYFPSDCEIGQLSVSEDWLEFHILIGASIYDALSTMQILYTRQPVFEITPEPYLIKWMYGLIAPNPPQTPDDIFELFFNTQKLLRTIHKTNTQFALQSEKEKLNAAQPMLCADFRNSISLEEIAASFGFSYETFRKKFKEYTGVSPLQFRLIAKFNFAQRLLADGYSIAKVAEETGYADPFIFSRQFKKYTGKNPKELKQKRSE